MLLINGIDHIALLSKDLDSLVAFYGEVFGATVRFDQGHDGQRHVGVDIGSGAYLHAFAAPANARAAGRPHMFERGHLDHISLLVEDEAAFQELRRRLVEHGASDGTVVHWGICREVVFTDPDGCVGEIAIAADERPRTFAERGVEAYAPTVPSGRTAPP